LAPFEAKSSAEIIFLSIFRVRLFMSDQSDKSSSYSLEELKESLGALRTRIFRRSVDLALTEAGRQARSSAEDFDALTRVNEDIRERCLGIVNRAEQLLALRGEFIQICGQVGKILKENEATTTSLFERNALLAREEQEHGALKARYHALRDEYESKGQEHSLLRAEAERYTELVWTREARIQSLEQELTQERDRGATLSGELETERSANSAATDKVAAALAGISANEAALADLRTQGLEIGDRALALEFDASALSGRLAESQALAKTLRRQLADSEQAAESLRRTLGESDDEAGALRSRVAASEAALASARLDHEAAEGLRRQKDQVAADEIADLNARLGVDRRRAEAADALLAEARQELKETGRQFRARERKAETLARKIGALRRA
jgi:chromosome segregation ATPase